MLRNEEGHDRTFAVLDVRDFFVSKEPYRNVVNLTALPTKLDLFLLASTRELYAMTVDRREDCQICL